MKKGDRVGAIFSSNIDKSVNFIGYGEYVGDFVPKEGAGWLAAGLISRGVKNPKILLDSGKVVYGCECWWGPEEKVKHMLKDRVVIETDIDEVRRTHAC